jgi:ABC-type nickel/cobalt efflux system permease component RcnA
MSLGLLFLGLLIGMRHAVETDHVAAVATLATRSRSLTEAVRQGAAWGLGHTLTLFLFGSIVLLLDSVIPAALAQLLELLVGVMLVGLGVDVLIRLLRERIHFHLHRHPEGDVHFHAHSHAGETSHDPDRHRHKHPAGFPVRALLVGLMHGMAGSAALILLTLQTVRSPLTGLAYIALFGLGSMIGMALLSIVIAIPLRASARGMTWLHNGLQMVVGLATVTIGAALILENSGRPILLF